MAKPFTLILNEIRYGAAAVEADDALIKVVAAVKATGRAGSVTIKITLNPPKRQSSGVHYIEVTDEISCKIPEPPKSSTIFFPTADNGLSQTDERQRSLPLGSVSREGDVEREPVTLEGSAS